MKIDKKDPPRVFGVGKDNSIDIRHCADINLEADEQITFMTASGTEYDVVRKNWGYYAAPSLNGRLKDHGLRAVLVKNQSGKLYLLLIEEGKETEFQTYLQDEEQEVVYWLDSDQAVRELCERLA